MRSPPVGAMMALTRMVEQFWWRKRPPPAWLMPLSMSYQWLNRRNLAQRNAQAEPPPLPWISVGNITVGGSGKTPFVLWLAAQLVARGWHPVLVCRGDGGRHGRGALPQRVLVDADPRQVGDEACMMAQASGLPVLAGRDRVQAARMAVECGDIMILDDGFQYRQLAHTLGKSCDVVLLPATGLGNGALLPLGPLREPVTALARADVVVASGEGRGNLPPIAARMWAWSNPVVSLKDGVTGAETMPDRVVVVAGIARPQRMVASLQQLGVTVIHHHFFPDHHRYGARDVEPLLSQPLPVVTSAKDAVKLHAMWPKTRPLWVCQHHPQAELGLINAILAHISMTA
ncbi:MAG: tetraacyldisaccharide 4'-kinase [Mariprofundales bacterium]|nr:tetraacyldisaccharide 4'-kinase [Mariprofundales bacterium]